MLTIKTAHDWRVRRIDTTDRLGNVLWTEWEVRARTSTNQRFQRMAGFDTESEAREFIASRMG